MVDLAAMREAVKTLGGDPKDVHPACPTDLTVDHSFQIDFSRWYLSPDVNSDGHRAPSTQPPSLRGADGRSGARPAA